jgi:hypothetical protein
MNIFMLRRALNEPQADLEQIKYEALAYVLECSELSEMYVDAVCIYIEALHLSGNRSYAHRYACIFRSRAQGRKQALYEAAALRLIVLTEPNPGLIASHLQDLEKLAVEYPQLRDMHQTLLAQFADTLQI